MNITRLEIEGFRSYGEKQTIDFQPNNLYLLTGENRDRGVSSAAGKSSILKAITTALFEENDDDSIRDNAINTTDPTRGCRIAVSFTDDTGTHYYVVYARSHYEEGTHWTLYRWTGAEWDAERGARITDTKGLIHKVIKMTYDQFVNQAYIPQHKVADFIGRTDKERKAIFGNLLGLDDCDKYQKAAADWRKALVAENLRLEGALSQVRHRAANVDRAELTSRQAALALEVEDRMARQGEHLRRFEELEEEAAKLSTIANLKAQEKAHDQVLESLAKQLGRVLIVGDPYEMLAKTNELEAQKEDLHERLREIEHNILHAEKRLVAWDSMEEVCEQCERPLPPLTKSDQVKRYRETLKNNKEAAIEMRAALKRAREAWDRSSQAYSQILSNQRERTRIGILMTEEEAKLAAVQTQLNDLRETIGDGVDIPNEIAEERRALLAEKSTNDKLLTETIRQLAVVEEQIARYDLDMQQEGQLVGQIDLVAKSLTSVKRCEELVGEKGFKSFKIHSSRDTFNQALGQSLSILTEGEIQATLVTEVPKADGKGAKAELDILVRDGEKSGVSIRQYSGGEKAFLSLGITGAFGELASQQSEGGVNLLLLDEPFANMDTWQEEQACKLLAKFAADGRIVIVVTNHQGVKDRGKFDTELRAVKENHVTHVEEYDLSGDH